MTSVLASSREENVLFAEAQEGVGAVISVVGNLAASSSLLAKYDANNTNENITGYTGNSTDGGIVSSKEIVSNTIKTLLSSKSDSLCRGAIPKNVSFANESQAGSADYLRSHPTTRSNQHLVTLRVFLIKYWQIVSIHSFWIR